MHVIVDVSVWEGCWFRHADVVCSCHVFIPCKLLAAFCMTCSLLMLVGDAIGDHMDEAYSKAQHSTVTALHTLNNTAAKGFNQMAPPARTITVALDMSKAFDTVNTHTLIGKLLQTSTSGTILKFVANYIKGRKAYTSSETTSPYNVRLKLAFLKAASYHPPYLTSTQQISPHRQHRYK